jgi:hypothetical protein
MSKRKPRKKLNSRRRNQQKQKSLSYGLFIGGIAIIAIGLIAGLGRGRASTNQINYEPEDIVYDSPLYAIHEMTPPTISNINFLPKGESQPKIAVSESFYDFGSIGPTDVAKHDFIIANQGDAPLTINRAYSTCGCTTAEFTSTVIPPGKVIVMTLILDAGFHDVSGQTVRRGIIIENNDPDNSQIEIWSQAKVRNSP